jgi:hypothetical protein
MKARQRSTTQENRRGFVRQCIGAGASLATSPVWSGQAAGSDEAKLPHGNVEIGLSEYKRILSHTRNMHVLGNPRSWSLVSQGLHPFAPERVVVMKQGTFGDLCGCDLRRQIDKQIEVEFGHMKGFEKNRFPDPKRESIYWMMDAMCGYYAVPYLEHWVVGLAGREILASTGWCGTGIAHQYQRGGEVPVDNPPYDWWLFLFPEGHEWAAMDEQPVFAVFAHVARNNKSGGLMLPLWALTEAIQKTVTDWSQVAQMGRVGACRYLNGITAQCLPQLGL